MTIYFYPTEILSITRFLLSHECKVCHMVVENNIPLILHSPRDLRELAESRRVG